MPVITGQGTAFKMLVNAQLAQSMLVYAETALLGESLGFSRDFLMDTLPNLPVSAPFLAGKAELIRSGDYAAQFPLEWMHKDLQLLDLTAYEQNQPLYLANLAKSLYGSAKAAGHGRDDFAAIHAYLANQTRRVTPPDKAGTSRWSRLTAARRGANRSRSSAPSARRRCHRRRRCPAPD